MMTFRFPVGRAALPSIAAFTAGIALAVPIPPAAAQTGAPGVDHRMHMSAETKPVPQPAQASDPLWFLKPEIGAPALYDDLGTHSFRVTTADPTAQRYFDQGLRLAYAFNHAEAARAFREAQRLDPNCAMCFWGEALVLGPNINAPMDPAAAAPAHAAAQKALALAGGASDKERALIEALTRRYAEQPPADRTPLDTAYADAMAAVAARYPDDADILALAAEAAMDTQPWDYWQPGGKEAKGRAGAAVAAIERALAIDPNHPGAIHYYIHLVEASDRPQRAEPYADKLGRLMPGAGHIVHMPSHVYYRVGRYLDSLEANRRAVAADEGYLAKVQAQGIYPNGYYPHNIHFLMTSAQTAGDGKTAIAAAEKLQRVLSDEAARAIPWVQPIKQAPYFAHAQYSDPATILALPEPGNALPFVKAAWHYARGVARAAQGDAAGAEGEAAAIARIEKADDVVKLEQAGVPGPTVLQIARAVLKGRIAQAKGDLKAAQAAFEEAVALQNGLPYMEPPFWYYPTQQSLGAVLLMQGDAAGAEQAFRTALDRAPQNGFALFGLREALRAKGDQTMAAEVDQRLGRAWAGDRGALDLKRL